MNGFWRHGLKDRYIHCKMQLAVRVRIFINTKRHLEDKRVKLKEDIIREYEGTTFFHFLGCDNV